MGTNYYYNMLDYFPIIKWLPIIIIGIIYQPNLVYFAIEDEFEEVIGHIAKTENRFNLNIKRFECSIAQVNIVLLIIIIIIY